MKYFYVAYCYSNNEGRSNGHGCFYSKRADDEINPSEMCEWVKKSMNFDSVVILNWVEISKEIFEKCTGELK